MVGHGMRSLPPFAPEGVRSGWLPCIVVVIYNGIDAEDQGNVGDERLYKRDVGVRGLSPLSAQAIPRTFHLSRGCFGPLNVLPRGDEGQRRALTGEAVSELE